MTILQAVTLRICIITQIVVIYRVYVVVALSVGHYT